MKRGTITAGMALFNLTEFCALCWPRDERLIGLDPGTKTIGVALSDVAPDRPRPTPCCARGKMKQNAAEIAAIAAREGAGGLVVGLPLDDGPKIRTAGAGGAGLGAWPDRGDRPAGGDGG